MIMVWRVIAKKVIDHGQNVVLSTVTMDEP